MLWGTSDFHSPARKSIQNLYRATSGSAGLDLSSSTYTVLTPEMGMQALPTGIYGPLPRGTVGLLLGRSSTTMKGILVQPGVIDKDYTAEIKIMTHSPTGISVIQSGQRITLLLLLPQVQTSKASKGNQRGNTGFGSSDVYWVQAIGAKRPEITLNINGKNFQRLLDTGADVSVFTDEQWPMVWPKQPTMTQLQGIQEPLMPIQRPQRAGLGYF